MKTVAALLLFGIVACQSASAQDSPSAKVEQYVAALNNHQFGKAAGYVDGANPATDFSRYLKFMSGLPKFVVTVTGTSKAGEKAVVLYRCIQGQRTTNETVHLRQVAGQWKVVPEKSSSSLGGYAYALAHPTMIPKAREAAKATAALSNAKQLAVGYLIYSGDNGDKFDLTSATAQKKLAPYLKNPALWTAPDDPKGTRSFSVNEALNGKSYETIRDLTKTVLLYEGRSGKPKFRYNGRAVIAFADGHAKLITQSEASQLIWKP